VDSPQPDISPKHHQQHKLEVTRQRIANEQTQMESTKQQMQQERRLHEIYIDEQRDLLKE